MKRNRILFLALILGSIAILWLVWPRDLSILGRARPIAGTGDWNKGGWHGYYWLDDHRILLFRIEEVADRAGGRTAFKWRAFELNTQTGKETPAAQLTEGL